ncbi:MAG TPA: M20/M25/M40 family metallo-hydrolase [Bryobacteraceae bacterium]|jgi:acetylornithine deacetylase/succinyl-diaminopimelate desuccinylase-like protein
MPAFELLLLASLCASHLKAAGHPTQQPKYATQFSPVLAADPIVETAFHAIDAREEPIVTEWIHLAEIPAPSGKEQERARYIRHELEKLKLQNIHTDEAGNVSGVRKGIGGGPAIVFCAHMDTVFPASTPLKVTREGHMLKGPGIGDDTGNLVALLELFRTLDKAQIRTKGDLIFLATTQEETRLQGARYWLTHAAHKPDMFIATDIPLGVVWYGALRLAALKFVYTASGAHTLMSRGEPNPVKAVARAITAVYQVQLPAAAQEAAPMRLPVINVGKIGGGAVINAIPKEAYFTVDLRSFDSATQDRLQTAVTDAARSAADAEHVGFQVEKPEGDDLDYSNAASRAVRRAHPLVETALDVYKYLKVALLPDAMDVGSTDANVGVSLGIPSIAIGATEGRDAHTLDESAEAGSIVPGVKSLVLLAVSMAELAN